MAITGPESHKSFGKKVIQNLEIRAFRPFDQNTIRISKKKECFGEFRTGKTQIAHTICVTAQAGFLILVPSLTRRASI